MYVSKQTILKFTENIKTWFFFQKNGKNKIVYKEIVTFLKIENYLFHLVLLFCSLNHFQMMFVISVLSKCYLFLINLKNWLVSWFLSGFPREILELYSPLVDTIKCPSWTMSNAIKSNKATIKELVLGKLYISLTEKIGK